MDPQHTGAAISCCLSQVHIKEHPSKINEVSGKLAIDLYRIEYYGEVCSLTRFTTELVSVVFEHNVIKKGLQEKNKARSLLTLADFLLTQQEDKFRCWYRSASTLKSGRHDVALQM